MPKKSKPAKESQATSSNVDLAEIERLLEFMQQHGLQEFEYEREGLRVVLKKAVEQSPEIHRGILPAVAGVPVSLAAPSVESPSAATEKQQGIAASEDLHIIKSPIVGTFYGSPSPDAEPFVAIGATVEAGQVLCIVEAMKLMNEIESDIAGEIARIFVENGHPVEYGESLFGIRPLNRK